MESITLKRSPEQDLHLLQVRQRLENTRGFNRRDLVVVETACENT